MRAVALALLVVLVLSGCGDERGEPAVPAARTAAPDPARAHAAPARAFLDRYVDPDGRVVRHDQGGDTVSEGQAYALLLSVAIGDRTRFDRVWRWTASALQREDGLLAWRWAGGEVADPQPAADADLDAARALALAARRFDRPAYARHARRITRAVRREMTRDGVLVAGPWAMADGTVNPSYASPRAAADLDLAAAGSDAIRPYLDDARLPPDWGREGRAIAAPGTADPPRYGFDAVRLPVRLAESCDPADRRAAAGWWPVLRQDAGRLPRELDGRPADGAGLHPVALVGAAAAAQAAGARRDARALLQLARARDDAHPSYYGGAWVALGRIMLRTRLLGAC